MKYTVVLLILLSVLEPVQGSYLTELMQLFSTSSKDPISSEDAIEGPPEKKSSKADLADVPTADPSEALKAEKADATESLLGE